MYMSHLAKSSHSLSAVLVSFATSAAVVQIDVKASEAPSIAVIVAPAMIQGTQRHGTARQGDKSIKNDSVNYTITLQSHKVTQRHRLTFNVRHLYITCSGGASTQAQRIRPSHVTLKMAV